MSNTAATIIMSILFDNMPDTYPLPPSVISDVENKIAYGYSIPHRFSLVNKMLRTAIRFSVLHNVSMFCLYNLT